MRYKGEALGASEDGIFMRKGDAESLGAIKDFRRFLAAVWDNMPRGSVLVLADSDTSTDFQAFLSEHAPSSALKVAGADRSDPQIEIRPDLRDAFFDQCDRITQQECLCVDLMVYDRNGAVLIYVFEDGGDVWARRDLPAEVLSALSATLRPRMSRIATTLILLAIVLTLSIYWIAMIRPWQLGFGLGVLVLIGHIGIGLIVVMMLAFAVVGIRYAISALRAKS